MTAPEEADITFSSRTTFFPHLSFLAALRAAEDIGEGLG